MDSFDPALAYGRFGELARKIEPEMGALIDELEKAAKDITGLRLREDLLSHLGPTWCVLPVPSADGQGGGKAEVDPTEYVLVASLQDADGFSKVLDTLAARANQYLRDREKPADGQARDARQPDPPSLAVERLPGTHRGYRLTSPSRLVFWLNDEIQPTILVGKSYVAFAVNAERAAEALAFEQGPAGRWRPTGELIAAFDCLPEKLTLLSVGDSRDSAVPETISQLPSIVQLLMTWLGGMEDPNAGAGSDFLTLLGIPGPGSFRVRIDPARIPRSEAPAVSPLPQCPRCGRGRPWHSIHRPRSLPVRVCRQWHVRQVQREVEQLQGVGSRHQARLEMVFRPLKRRRPPPRVPLPFKVSPTGMTPSLPASGESGKSSHLFSGDNRSR